MKKRMYDSQRALTLHNVAVSTFERAVAGFGFSNTTPVHTAFTIPPVLRSPPHALRAGFRSPP